MFSSVGHILVFFKPDDDGHRLFPLGDNEGLASLARLLHDLAQVCPRLNERKDFFIGHLHLRFRCTLYL